MCQDDPVKCLQVLGHAHEPYSRAQIKALVRTGNTQDVLDKVLLRGFATTPFFQQKLDLEQERISEVLHRHAKSR